MRIMLEVNYILKTNRTRDKKIDKALKKKGWKVLRIWEHEIKRNPKEVIYKIKRYVPFKKP